MLSNFLIKQLCEPPWWSFSSSGRSICHTDGSYKKSFATDTRKWIFWEPQFIPLPTFISNSYWWCKRLDRRMQIDLCSSLRWSASFDIRKLLRSIHVRFSGYPAVIYHTRSFAVKGEMIVLIDFHSSIHDNVVTLNFDKTHYTSDNTNHCEWYGFHIHNHQLSMWSPRYGLMNTLAAQCDLDQSIIFSAQLQSFKPFYCVAV